MGRILAYLGPNVPVAKVLEAGTFPLIRQVASASDGFGVAWHPLDGDPAPVRVVGREPLGAEPSLLDLLRRQGARATLAALGKSERAPAELSGCQPFLGARHAFAAVAHFESAEGTFLRALREELSDASYASLRGISDAELLAAAFSDALERRTGSEAIADALERVAARVRQLSIGRGLAASLSAVVADGASLVVLRTSTHGTPPPLYTVVVSAPAPFPAGARLVASEPSFPGAWEALDSNSLTIFEDEV